MKTPPVRGGIWNPALANSKSSWRVASTNPPNMSFKLLLKVGELASNVATLHVDLLSGKVPPKKNILI